MKRDVSADRVRAAAFDVVDPSHEVTVHLQRTPMRRRAWKALVTVMRATDYKAPGIQSNGAVEGSSAARYAKPSPDFRRVLAIDLYCVVRAGRAFETTLVAYFVG
jgi:hypothetical protein